VKFLINFHLKFLYVMKPRILFLHYSTKIHVGRIVYIDEMYTYFYCIVERPSLDEVLRHAFLRNGPIPLRIPLSALYTAPVFEEHHFEPRQPEERPITITTEEAVEQFLGHGK
jgi:hypothetical protein